LETFDIIEIMRKSSGKVLVSLLLLFVMVSVFAMKSSILELKFKITQVFNTLSYSFQDQFAQVLYINEHIKIPIVFRKQKHALSCEAASLAMALNYRGAKVTEDELLAQLTFDMKGPKTKNNIWGDPEKGFVGSVDGSIFFGTGYGVYEKPVRDVAFIYRDAYVLEKPTLLDVLDQVNNGNPVLVWGTLSDTEPVYWKTKEGKNVKAFPGEHARIVIGWAGDIENPTKIILMDPIYGKIRLSTDKFLSSWAMLDNRSVVIF
jgi:uncharacterized protein YvpB